MELTQPRRHVTYEAAQALVDKGISIARADGVSITVVVVDTSGGIVAAGRLDGAHARTIEFARGKAVYSAASGKTTAQFVEKRLEPNEVLWKALSEDQQTFLVPGGFPLLMNGESVGGFGVSGAAYHVDVEIAERTAAYWDELVAAAE